MKYLLALLMVVGLITPIASAQQRVRGYMRSNGTYVQPYYKTRANSTRFDNYSTKGNYNPYSGRRGYKNPYGSSFNSYSQPRRRRNAYGW